MMTNQGQSGTDRLEDWLLLRSAFYAGRSFLEQLRHRRSSTVAGLFEKLQRMFLLGISGREFPHRNQAEETRFREARYCPLCGQRNIMNIEDGIDHMQEETQGVMILDKHDDDGALVLCDVNVGNDNSNDRAGGREVEAGHTQTYIEAESSC